MPQYEFFFLFFFNGKGTHPRCLSKTWQLYIVNRVAGGSTKKAWCLFWTNRDKRSLFTHRYDRCFLFAWQWITDLKSKSCYLLIIFMNRRVHYIMCCSDILLKGKGIALFHLYNTLNKIYSTFSFLMFCSQLIIWLENFASGSVIWASSD